jgi:hypothetical protein
MLWLFFFFLIYIYIYRSTFKRLGGVAVNKEPIYYSFFIALFFKMKKKSNLNEALYH